MSQPVVGTTGVSLDSGAELALGTGSVSAPTVTLRAAGAITDTAGGPDLEVVAGMASLSAQTGLVSLETDVDSVQVVVEGTGDVLLRNTGPLSLTQAVTADGSLSVSTTGLLTAQDVQASGVGRDVVLAGGAVRMGTVSAPDILVVTSTGAIAQTTPVDGAPDLTARAISLTAGGTINPLEVDATSLRAAISGMGAMSITDTAGGLNVGGATTEDGNITLASNGGSLRL